MNGLYQLLSFSEWVRTDGRTNERTELHFLSCVPALLDATKNLMYLDINQRKKSKLKIVLWFVVKFLYAAHMKRIFNKKQLYMEILKELEWNIIQMRRIGSLNEMRDLKEIIEKEIKK